MKLLKLIKDLFSKTPDKIDEEISVENKENETYTFNGYTFTKGQYSEYWDEKKKDAYFRSISPTGTNPYA